MLTIKNLILHLH